MQPWLYIVIVGAFLIVFAYLRPKNSASNRAAAVNDIETALDQFAEELEDGNKELMISIQGLKRELEAEINKLNGRLTVLENQSNMAAKLLDSRNELSKVTDLHRVTERVIVDETISLANNEEAVPEAKRQDNDIKNRYGTIFELHAEGKSIEYIAKKIGMNKGEIQLIIQLARQEEQFRA